VLDVGCGVGGPMRNIAAFTGADITGVTINDYQVRVGNKYNALKGLDKSCRYVRALMHTLMYIYIYLLLNFFCFFFFFLKTAFSTML
jgi:ubiquinone/menaquinone biosynthesis C-methylase UbiE